MPYVIEYDRILMADDDEFYIRVTAMNIPLKFELLVEIDPNDPKMAPIGFINELDGHDMMLDFRNNKLYEIGVIFSRNRKLYHRFGTAIVDSRYEQMVALL